MICVDQIQLYLNNFNLLIFTYRLILINEWNDRLITLVGVTLMAHGIITHMKLSMMWLSSFVLILSRWCVLKYYFHSEVVYRVIVDDFGQWSLIEMMVCLSGLSADHCFSTASVVTLQWSDHFIENEDNECHPNDSPTFIHIVYIDLHRNLEVKSMWWVRIIRRFPYTHPWVGRRTRVMGGEVRVTICSLFNRFMC